MKKAKLPEQNVLPDESLASVTGGTNETDKQILNKTPAGSSAIVLFDEADTSTQKQMIARQKSPDCKAQPGDKKFILLFSEKRLTFQKKYSIISGCDNEEPFNVIKSGCGTAW